MGKGDRRQFLKHTAAGLARVEPGKYDVLVTWGVPDADAKQPYAVEVDGKVVITGRVASTGGYTQFARIKIGQIELKRPQHRFAFRAAGKIRNDLVDFWDRPTGGRVFHFGAIRAGWALSADPKMQRLMRNVLHHFGIKPTKT